MRNQHDEWETVVPQGMLVNHALQGLAMLDSYPLDRRLWAHLRSDPNAHWPAKARREQHENANLTERGVTERKTYAVSTHALDLWSEFTQEEPEAEEILRRAEDRVHEIPHQFGRPTVHVPNYEERLKPKKKEVPPSRRSESEQTRPGSKRTAGPRKFGGRPTYDAKRGKGTGVHRTTHHREFGSQLSVRSDLYGLLQDPGTQALLWNILSNVRGVPGPHPPPASSLPAPTMPDAAVAAAAPAQQTQRRRKHVRATSPWPSERKNQAYAAPADDEVNDDDMVVEDLDAGQAPVGPRPEQDPAMPTDTVPTVTSAAESSATTGTSDEAASKSSTKTVSDGSSAAASLSSPSAITTTTSAESAGARSTSNHGHLGRGCVEEFYEDRKRWFQCRRLSLFALCHHHDHLCRVCRSAFDYIVSALHLLTNTSTTTSGTSASSTASSAPARTSPSSVKWPRGPHPDRQGRTP